MLQKILRLIIKHKLAALFLSLILIFGGYKVYQSIFSTAGEVKYVFGQVKKDTLVVSLSGSGQVSASNQLEMKPKVSGDITGVYVKAGQEVKAGTLLVSVDVVDAERSARDAATSLETAKLELDKLLEPVDELTLLQAENSLTQTKESKQNYEDNLKKAYEDGFNTVSNAFLDLPDVMIGLHDVLLATNLSVGQANMDYFTDSVKIYDNRVTQYRNDTYNKYQAARATYDKNFSDYKATSRFADRQVIEDLINQTYDTTKSIAESVKNANNLIQFYKDTLTNQSLKPNATATTYLSDLSSYTSKTNSLLSSLLSITRTIQDSKDSIVSATRSIEEKELSLAKIKKGPEDLEIRAKRIAVQQKQDALLTAQEALANHYIRAPFDGIVAKVDVKKGDLASSGSVLATMITKQKIVNVSLNEVDIAKVKVGQKVTLTFDAIPDLTITGSIAEVDAVGTVSQGVVTYETKIVFDTQDDRVKAAMSVTAVIITDVKSNIIVVPNSAIKTQGNTSYVEVADGDNATLLSAGNAGVILKTPPRRQTVQIGLTNDESSEIASGIKEGDLIIIRTIQPSAQSASQTTAPNSGLRLPGITGGSSGGANRNFSR